MGSFLSFVGILLIIASAVVSILSGQWALLVFPVMLALGCMVLGLGKIIKLLQEIKDRDVK